MECEKNDKLFSILSNDPSKLFQSIRQLKGSKAKKISELKVTHKTYRNENVADGFYDSISQLKTVDLSHMEDSDSFTNFSEDYEHLKIICNQSAKIPAISTDTLEQLLSNFRPKVNDIFSITALHYINGGREALLHLSYLLNSIIDSIQNTACKELNTVHAHIPVSYTHLTLPTKA